MLLAGGTQDARRHCLAGSGERVRPAQGQAPTPRDTERQNRAFIRDPGSRGDREGQGETPGCGQIAVKTCQPVEKIGLRPSVE
jgi:hypothetical protein